MARPNKEGLDYFPLDTDIDKDDKIALIEAKHGIAGFGVIIKMYGKIYYGKGYYYDWNKETQLLFAKQVGLEVEKVIEIINDAIWWDLFDKNLFKKYQILTSKRIQKTYIEATKRRKEVLLLQKYILDGVNGYINKLNANIILINDNINTQTETEIETESIYSSDLKNKSEQILKINFNFSTNSWENITEEDKRIWKEAYPACDIEIELKRMRAWILSAGAKGHKKNWERFINNWLTRSQDRGGTKNGEYEVYKKEYLKKPKFV